MKKITYLVLLCLLSGLQYIAAETTTADTSFTYRNKLINVDDSVGQVRVKIFEVKSPNDTLPLKKVFEGLYSDEKSYEKWTVIEDMGFQIPFLSKKHHHRNYTMESHWGGIGYGLANVTNEFLNFSAINGFSLNAIKSREFFLNCSEIILPIYRNNLGITTGFGFDWRNYHFDNTTHLTVTNGITTTAAAPENIHYKYSRLRTVYMTFPLLLEWQPTFGNNHSSYLAGGIVGGVKTLSSAKVKYEDSEGHTVKKVEGRGLNVSPLTMDYIVMGGIHSVSVYAKYSPFSIFQKGKGPDAKAISIGLALNF